MLVTAECHSSRQWPDVSGFFGSAWKTKHVTGTVIIADNDVINGRGQRSVTVDCTIRERAKRITLKQETSNLVSLC